MDDTIKFLHVFGRDFEGSGGRKGLVKQCVEVIKTDYLSPAETILQRLASVRCFQIPET